MVSATPVGPVMFFLGLFLLTLSPLLAAIAVRNGLNGGYGFAACMLLMPIGLGLILGSGSA